MNEHNNNNNRSIRDEIDELVIQLSMKLETAITAEYGDTPDEDADIVKLYRAIGKNYYVEI